jgi:hypothetical protein
MDGRMARRMDGRMDGWMDGRTDKRTDGRTDGQTDRQTDGRTDGVGACCKSKTSTQVPSTVLSQFLKKKKAKFLLYLQTGKESIGVSRISQFYAGAGIKQKPSHVPFSKNYKNERHGTSLFCPEVPRDKQNQVQNKIAPMIAPKFGPTLRTGMGSTAGAMADGSQAAEGGLVAAKCQKTVGRKSLMSS